MVRKTRRSTPRGKSKQSGINSIPELRRAFEYIEEYVDTKIKKHESKDKIAKELRKEWQKVFSKELNKASSDAFVSNRMEQHSHTSYRVIRRKGGSAALGSAALGGAPLDYTTRAGVHLAPGQIPDTHGHLPQSNGGASIYGSFTDYISKGFWNPEIGKQYDPLVGQSAWPMPSRDMGSNAFHAKGGHREKGRRTRKSKRGTSKGGGILDSAGTLLTQAFTRPIQSGAPPPVLQDMQDMWHGKQVGVSPDQVQRQVPYLVGSLYPRTINA